MKIVFRLFFIYIVFCLPSFAEDNVTEFFSFSNDQSSPKAWVINWTTAEVETLDFDVIGAVTLCPSEFQYRCVLADFNAIVFSIPVQLGNRKLDWFYMGRHFRIIKQKASFMNEELLLIESRYTKRYYDSIPKHPDLEMEEVLYLHSSRRGLLSFRKKTARANGKGSSSFWTLSASELQFERIFPNAPAFSFLTPEQLQIVFSENFVWDDYVNLMDSP